MDRPNHYNKIVGRALQYLEANVDADIEDLFWLWEDLGFGEREDEEDEEKKAEIDAKVRAIITEVREHHETLMHNREVRRESESLELCKVSW